MDRRMVGFKEKYEQVSEYEYNEINPYEVFRATIKQKYPDAKIKSTRTFIENFGALQVPMMVMFYEVPECES